MTYPQQQRAKILLVDDSATNLTLLGQILSPDYDILVAISGETALEIAQGSEPPDLILLDVMMPGMDGYETTQAIRERAQFRALPIIALTAKAMKGDREKCIAAGASDYITKPVDTDQLLSLMRVWLYDSSSTI